MPDFNQALHQGVVGDKGVLPYSVDDLCLAQEAAVIFGQKPQHLEGFGPELHICATLSQASTPKIDDKPVEP
jgi:hypothetical protein